MDWAGFIQRIGCAMDVTGYAQAMTTESRRSPYRLIVRHHFSAGHRIPGLPGPGAKCANLHGHTFGINWTFDAPDLDAETIEFGAMKKVLRGWVDEVLDHGFMVGATDTHTIALLRQSGSKMHVMNHAPTTEAIADMLAHQAMRDVPQATLREVEVTEGPHNAARWCA